MAECPNSRAPVSTARCSAQPGFEFGRGTISRPVCTAGRASLLAGDRPFLFRFFFFGMGRTARLRAGSSKGKWQSRGTGRAAIVFRVEISADVFRKTPSSSPNRFKLNATVGPRAPGARAAERNSPEEGRGRTSPRRREKIAGRGLKSDVAPQAKSWGGCSVADQKSSRPGARRKRNRTVAGYP